MSVLNTRASVILSVVAAMGFASAASAETPAEQLAVCREKVSAYQGLRKTGGRLIKEHRTARELAEHRIRGYDDYIKQIHAALGEEVKAFRRDGRLVVQVPVQLLFDLGSDQLRPDSAGALAKLAGVLKAITGRDMLIGGHTDNISVKKKNPSYSSNWQLSMLRALSVVEALERAGVPGGQMGAAGFGEYRPAADNSTEEGRKANRRIEIIVMPMLEEIPELPPTI